MENFIKKARSKITQRRTNPADVSHLDPDSVFIIADNFQNTNKKRCNKQFFSPKSSLRSDMEPWIDIQSPLPPVYDGKMPGKTLIDDVWSL